MFDVRPSGNADEFARSVYGIAQYFGGPLDEERIDRFSQVLPIERMHAAIAKAAREPDSRGGSPSLGFG